MLIHIFDSKSGKCIGPMTNSSFEYDLNEPWNLINEIVEIHKKEGADPSQFAYLAENGSEKRMFFPEHVQHRFELMDFCEKMARLRDDINK